MCCDVYCMRGARTGHAPRTPLHVQDQNFALFNFVNELNGECEKLEGKISELRSEIETYKGQGLCTDSQRKKILKARWMDRWKGEWMGGLCGWNSARIDLTPSSTSPPPYLGISPECISAGPPEAAGAHRS